MKVICDKCRYRFDLKNKDIKKQSFLGITEDYYNCPKCKEKYVVAIHNMKTEKLKKEIDILRKKKVRTKKDYDDLQSKIEEFKKEMDKLNNK